MEVVREKPCQRLHHRVTAPLKVTLENGHTLIAANWSLGGIRLDDLPQPLPEIGNILKLKLELPFQGFDISFDAEAEVVRTVGETGTIGAKFQALSERASDLMGHFIEDLIRGKMATIEDTICRIDIPVTPISTKPDPNPASKVPVRRWPVKTVLMSVFYILLGISVFAYLAFLIFSHTTRMEVTSALVSAPIAHLAMPMDGKVIPIALRKGVFVRKGQKLARVVDPGISSRIFELKLELEKDRRDLMRSRERLRIEENRMKLYRMVSETDHQVARARVEAAREALVAADTRFERLSMLRQKGLIQQSKLDAGIASRAKAEADLKRAELQLQRSAAMKAGSTRRHYRDEKFVADLDLLSLEVEEANSRLSMTNMRLEKLETEQAGLVVTAPFDGQIVAVNAAANTTVLKGHKIITIEKAAEPKITAFLDQEEIARVGMHDEASVFLPALGKSFKAKVQKIDISSSSIRPDASHYVWSGEKEKSASVALALQVPEADRNLVRGGLPAVVIFSKRSTSSLYTKLAGVFDSAGS